VTRIFVLCNTAHLYFDQWADHRCQNWFQADLFCFPSFRLVGSSTLAPHPQRTFIDSLIQSVIEGKHLTDPSRMREEWLDFSQTLCPLDRLACTELSLLNFLFSKSALPDTAHTLFSLLESS
jgi:hypothetical protein